MNRELAEHWFGRKNLVSKARKIVEDTESIRTYHGFVLDSTAEDGHPQVSVFTERGTRLVDITWDMLSHNPYKDPLFLTHY